MSVLEMLRFDHPPARHGEAVAQQPPEHRGLAAEALRAGLAPCPALLERAQPLEDRRHFERVVAGVPGVEMGSVDRRSGMRIGHADRLSRPGLGRRRGRAFRRCAMLAPIMKRALLLGLSTLYIAGCAPKPPANWARGGSPLDIPHARWVRGDASVEITGDGRMLVNGEHQLTINRGGRIFDLERGRSP